MILYIIIALICCALFYYLAGVASMPEEVMFMPALGAAAWPISAPILLLIVIGIFFYKLGEKHS
jgi:hypothetical protein